jgi:hypothetical protein
MAKPIPPADPAPVTSAIRPAKPAISHPNSCTQPDQDQPKVREGQLSRLRLPKSG